MEEEIIQGNKLIAIFHGWHHIKTPKEKGKGVWNFPDWNRAAYNEDSFKYHSSWDWLKPVVDKIFEYSIAYPEQVKWVTNAKIVIDITPCWNNVIKFIKWYNTNQPPLKEG